LLAVNYRGYGGNPGSPSESALFADALALHDWAVLRTDVDPARIVAIGRSLGSGVAVYLAAERPLAGVVLVTPYDSFRAVAQRHYPYVPVSLLLKHSFDSIRRAPGISLPVLVLAAQRDDVVPLAHARALFSKWGGPKTWREFAGAGHNDLEADPAFWSEIASLLRQIAR
jgi:pimeloyl-ACP methyl ester carboxylesterase